jgi:hypothetical protein
MMLAGWQESHTQGVRVTFWLADATALDPFRSATVRKGKTAGQRYMAVLVEVGDDEKPVRHPSNDAHLLLTGDDFLRYAKSMGSGREAWDPARAREWAKYVMGVKSLSELDSDPAALARYEQLVRRPFARWNGTLGDDDAYDDDRNGESLDAGEPE